MKVWCIKYTLGRVNRFKSCWWNGYYERVLYKDGKQINHWRKPGFFQKVDHTHVHTITLNDNSKDSCWTLFIPFKRKNDWGFFKKINESYEFIDSKTYLIEKCKKNWFVNYLGKNIT